MSEILIVEIITGIIVPLVLFLMTIGFRHGSRVTDLLSRVVVLETQLGNHNDKFDELGENQRRMENKLDAFMHEIRTMIDRRNWTTRPDAKP